MLFPYHKIGDRWVSQLLFAKIVWLEKYLENIMHHSIYSFHSENMLDLL